MYRELIENILDLYGTRCSIRPYGAEEAISCNAFITPMNYKDDSFGGLEYRDNGAYDGRYYRYIGKAENDLSRLPDGSTIVCAGRIYRTDSSDLYVFDNEPLYCRAVLRLYKDGEADD